MNELHSTGQTISFPMAWEPGAIYRVLSVTDGQAVFERLADYHVSLNMLEPRTSDDGRVVIDPIEHRCLVEGVDVKLSRREWNLMTTFLAHGNRAATRTSLLTYAWGPEYVDDFQYLRVWLTRLRHKIGAQYFESVHAYGYRLVGFSGEIEQVAS